MEIETIIKKQKCEVRLVKDFISERKAKKYFIKLLDKVSWRKDTIKLFGKTIPIPRQQAWYGDRGKSYTYSKITLEPLPWFRELKELKCQAEKFSNCCFNSVLINLYQNGTQYSAWHSDDEKELGINPSIASISLGETRTFHLRDKKSGETTKLSLPNASILIMEGSTQHIYKHQLAKTAKIVGPRINLTFRNVIK